MIDTINAAEQLVRSLRLEANARNVALMDSEGNAVAADLDGAFDASGFFAEIREAPEREFDFVDEAGDPWHVKLEPFAGGRFTLFVMYDDHSTLGLVRLAIKRSRAQFEAVLASL